LIEGVAETLAKLRAAGKKMFFVTNNSMKSRKGYKKKVDSLGWDSVPADEIFSSSFAAAAYKFSSFIHSMYVVATHQLSHGFNFDCRSIIIHHHSLLLPLQNMNLVVATQLLLSLEMLRGVLAPSWSTSLFEFLFMFSCHTVTLSLEYVTN
jgi:Haloacid dehalogenase-like hydrolase